MSTIDLRSQKQQVGEDPADNIIKIINAAAQAKQAKLKLEQELMLDDIKRSRDLRDKGLEQQQTQQNETAGFERMFGGMANAGTPQQVAQNTPWQPSQEQYTAENPPPMSMPDGSVSGNPAPVQPQAQPQQQAQPVMYNGVRLPSAMEIAQGERASGNKVNVNKLRIYNETWQKARQGLASEGEMKMLADMADIPVEKEKSVEDRKYEQDLQDRERQNKVYKESVINSAQDTLDTIAEVEAGIKHFGLLGDVPPIPGTDKANWVANVNKLTSSKVLDMIKTMKDASKTGATGFGALSEKELTVLENSSTALKRNLSPKDAQKYIDKIKEAAKKVVQGNIQSFNSEAEVEAANLPSGTRIMINGREAIWE